MAAVKASHSSSVRSSNAPIIDPSNTRAPARTSLTSRHDGTPGQAGRDEVAIELSEHCPS